MAVYRKFYSFAYYLAEVFTSGSGLNIDLTNTAPNQTDTVIGDISVIDQTYLIGNSLDDTGTSTTGVYSLEVLNTTLSAIGGPVGPFRYIVISSGSNLICYYDYGYSITLSDGQNLDLNFSAGKLFTVQ